jgi:DNA-binding SARP family transcriptional activator
MADLEFRMLGPLEVLRQGVAVPLGPGRARTLLGILLVEANRVVAADRLLEELWTGDPPSSAAHAVQVYVSNLRGLLEPDRDRGATAQVLVGRRPGYVLVVAPDQCDAGRFEALVGEGQRALDQDRAADASQAFGQALDLWRGPVLADLADEPFVEVVAARLEELRLVATERRVDAGLALGRHGELVSELEALVRRHPFRERLWAQLILALYRSGRQAEALSAYRRVRVALGEELGLDPGPELRRLEAAVLHHDPILAAPSLRKAVHHAGPAASAVASPAAALPVGAGVSTTGDTPIDELRVVTALFADLVGSTPLGEQLPPEELSIVVNGAVDRMAACVEALGGTVASRPGDGILALFGAPVSHEDDPERAVLAALRIVRDVATYGEEVARSWDVDPLRARVGIDTGPVLVGIPGDPTVLGDALNTAARLEGAARPGSVVVSAAIQNLVDPLFDWGVPQQLVLKGKAAAVAAVEVLAARPLPGKVRGLEGRRLPIIGREPEMAAAGGSVDALLAGTGGVLIISGEAGTGKSRLLAELRQGFERSVSPGGRCLWLEGRCLSWGEALVYGPFRELLREWLGASPTHPALRTRVTLRRRVEELFGAGSVDVAGFLAGVLGLPLEPQAAERLAPLSPDALQRATFDALRSLLERLAAEGPVVVAIDDLHWADATSLQLVEHLLPATESAAILLVLAQRTEQDHGSWRTREAALRELAHRTREVSLGALTADADARMLDELVGTDTLPEAVARALLDAAEGNPLFIEELVRSLVDARALQRGPQGWRFERQVTVEIPRRIEQVLVSRIDRLPAAGRAVLRSAAVLGRQFELGLLEKLCGQGTDLTAALGNLQHLGLIHQVRRWPSAEYRFRHILIQEAAYRGLAGDRRRDLHRRAARALEMLPERLAESHGLLAFHCERAGEPELALSYHRLAADAAERAGALVEAVRHHTAALEVVASLPPEREQQEGPRLHLSRGRAWWHLADERAAGELRKALTTARAAGDTACELEALEHLWVVEGLVHGHQDRALERLEEALAIARRTGDRAAEVTLRNRLTVALVNRLELDRALENGQEALATARRSDDAVLAARAMDGLKLVAFVLGDYPTLRELADELEEVLRRQDDRWYLQYLLAESAFAVAARGGWDEALRRLDEAQAMNAELGSRHDVPYLLTLRSRLERTRGRYGDALGLARAATAAAHEDGNTQWIAWSEADLGAMLVELGATGEAIEHLEEGRSAALRGGIRIQLVRAVAHLSHARLLIGEADASSRELETAEEMLDRVTTPPGRAFLYGLDAYLAVARVRLALDGRHAAVERVRPLLEAAESAGWAEGVARSTLMLGECAALHGDLEAATDLFARSLETAQRGQLPPVEWQAHAEIARLLRGRSDRMGATTHLRLARAIVTTLNASITEPQIRTAFGAMTMELLED